MDLPLLERSLMMSAFNFRNVLGFLRASCSFALPTNIKHTDTGFPTSFKDFIESQGSACALQKRGWGVGVGGDGEGDVCVVLRHILKNICLLLN